MNHFRLGLIIISVAVDSCPIAHVHIFHIGKMPFVKVTYFFKNFPAVNRRAAAGRENLRRPVIVRRRLSLSSGISPA